MWNESRFEEKQLKKYYLPIPRSDGFNFEDELRLWSESKSISSSNISYIFNPYCPVSSAGIDLLVV